MTIPPKDTIDLRFPHIYRKGFPPTISSWPGRFATLGGVQAGAPQWLVVGG